MKNSSDCYECGNPLDMLGDGRCNMHLAREVSRRMTRPAWDEQARIGRPQRDETIKKIERAYTQEYLTDEEREERVSRAIAAKTQGQLDTLTADLSRVGEGNAEEAARKIVAAAIAPPKLYRKLTGWFHIAGIIEGLAGMMIIAAGIPHNSHLSVGPQAILSGMMLVEAIVFLVSLARLGKD
jgi:hypothetical protein